MNAKLLSFKSRSAPQRCQQTDPFRIADRSRLTAPEKGSFSRCPFHVVCLQGFRLLVLSGLTAAWPAWAQRDPFWPIGYEPPKAEPPAAEAAAPVKTASPSKEPAKPLPPPVKPVTEADWTEARKTVDVSGFTRSKRPDTGETRTHVMINRRTYSVGDSLSITNSGIHFTWHIESLTDRDLQLKPVEATRITAPHFSLKQ